MAVKKLHLKSIRKEIIKFKWEEDDDENTFEMTARIDDLTRSSSNNN